MKKWLVMAGLLFLFDLSIFSALTKHGWPPRHIGSAPGGGWTLEPIPTTTTDLVVLTLLLILHVAVVWRLVISYRDKTARQ